MNRWPITIEGHIYPSRGKIQQWEIGSRDSYAISQLPLNPYNITVGTGKGIPITCKYRSDSLVGQFHRKVNNKGIWIYTNNSNAGPNATYRWYNFLSKFGIFKGQSHKEIPICMVFYPDFVEFHLTVIPAKTAP